MQIKLIKQDNLSVSAYFNEKIITTSDWEVFVKEDEKDSDEILTIIKDPKTGNELKLVIKKYANIEKSDSNESNESNKENNDI